MKYDSYENTPDCSPSRPDYAAVPLNPWSALHPTGEGSYYSTSLERIRNKTDCAFATALEQGWVESPDVALRVHDLITASLIDAHVRRIDTNHSLIDTAQLQADPKVLELAQKAAATPEQLLTILKDNPQLGSIELAKLSHPIDFAADEDMVDAIAYALDGHATSIPLSTPHYKRKRYVDSVGGIFLRKRVVGCVELDDDNSLIEIIERRSFVMRTDEEASEQFSALGLSRAPISRLVGNETRLNELAECVEQALHYAPEADLTDLKWIQPTTSSYYARVTRELAETEDPAEWTRLIALHRHYHTGLL